jgi:hypothetical protein
MSASPSARVAGRLPIHVGDESMRPQPRCRIAMAVDAELHLEWDRTIGERHPRAELTALRAAEAARLSSYGWVDRAGGAVHLPLNRAIALTVERGLPGWPKQ